MLKAVGPTAYTHGLRAGSVGEVKGWSEKNPGQLVVDFPNFQLPKGYVCVTSVPSNLIPINDPDADITETTDKPIEEFV